ncbi:dTDP-4-amino-4,6-dideoxygalactose transaminase [Algoriphagus ratkowskyi]|uniref:GDP-perosamine synthase n=1 Tax=Algoriphagus ratkowskyi TaxID=57028 RepID=A0A2W7S436_9BACT|nr:DegT/DnrJ/EryC1/StrS family aminotransferase [Algoriphagus ratkowskyi]PZX57815.1 dTDP-4-amino-4,6-dideoxygalactose transaminase [Algoriphagus ratkowskyi]TXD79078.1 pyridoxal phosphate-dependent aminotransferase [Algoriphagus ratkowskyi]
MKDQKPKIWLSSPHLGENEFKYVKEAFDTNWVAPVGPHISRFEESLSLFANNQPVAALTSGTAALHLALILSGVGPGDYVICQSLTFAASANPIRYLGAIPVFVDSEEETWNMCPRFLEEAIENCLKGQFKTGASESYSGKAKMPKAIIPVHLYGMPANMPEINKIAGKYGIPVIEDSAEALGSTLNNQFCGSFGEMGVFSFNGNKIITTSGGGALTSKNPEFVQKAKFLATQAREDAPHYEHKEIGYNYRLSNVSAAIGIGQVEVLPLRVSARRRNYDLYKENLKEISEIKFLPEPEGYYSNRWLTTVLIDGSQNTIDREKIRLALDEENIESRPIWKPMHLQPVFQNFPFVGGDVSANIFRLGLCLPSGSNLENSHIEKVVENIKQLFH